MAIRKTIKKSALAPTVLVAGGAGFIGSHLCEALLNKGARVVAIDNLRTNTNEYVKHLITNPRFALYDVDLNMGLPAEIDSVDYIYHLAGLDEYIYSKEDINLDSLLTNSLGTKNLLDLAKRSHAKFMLVSTIDVYEGMVSQAEVESYLGANLLNEKKYSTTEAKRFAEALIWEHFRKFDTDVRIVRLPEVYGPKMNLDTSGFLGPLIKNLIYGRDFEIEDDENREEYYLYIDDAVAGLVKGLFNEQTRGNIYSLIYDKPQKLLTTAFLLKDFADRRIEISFTNTNNNYSELKSPDTFNLGDLGWKPKIDFKEGILKTLDSFGYQTNTHSFKPAALVQDKVREEVFKDPGKDLYSLVSNYQARVAPKTPLQREYMDNTVQPEEFSIKKEHFVWLSRLLNKLFGDINLPNISVPMPEFFKTGWWMGGVSAVTVLLLLVTVFIVTPVLSMKTNADKGLKSMEAVYDHLSKLQLKEPVKDAENASRYFTNAKSSFNRLHWAFSIIGNNAQFNSINSLLSSIVYFSRSVYYVTTFADSFSGLWEILRPDSNLTLQDTKVSQATAAINSAKNFIQLAQADFKYVDVSLLPNSLKGPAQDYSNYLSKLANNLTIANIIGSELPRVLGMDAPQRFLILFQNSNEMRPTGGFVGSYGILELRDGKISNLIIDDIYNPDGQLDVRNIKIAPPKPVASILAEDRLYLRNANWNPDFSKSADTIKDLYYQATGVNVDGVMAIDLYFVQNLLEVTGPIYLASYNEEISAQNLYERAQFHSDYDYKAGSQQKKNFLTILGSKLLERFFSLPKDKFSVLGDALGKSLNERHLMVYFFNSTLNVLLDSQKWDGKLVGVNGDYLNIVNANLGGTKANYYVKNSYEYNVSAGDTRDGQLRSELKMLYEHTGESTDWPGGPYTDYVRVIVQRGSKLYGAKIIYPDGHSDDIFSKVITTSIDRYDAFELSFVLQPKSAIIVALNYDLPAGLNVTKNAKDYSLYWQKQPGTNGDKYSFSFAPPFGTEVDTTIPEMDPKQVATSGFLNSDKEIYIKIR